jgi:SAM-dependent methyltransferase
MFDFFRHAAQSQLALLRGHLNLLELMFQGGGAFYDTNSALSAMANVAAAGALRCWVAQHPADRAIRVLEVGAGTGGMTAELLPVLPPERTHYRYTDVSSYFEDVARRRFSAWPFLQFGLFDLDDPSPQGLAPHAFDVIVASNALHTARHMDGTMKNLMSLLAPGGIFLVAETVREGPVQLVSIAHLDGFQFSDQPGHRERPVLSVAQWRAQMLASGCVRFAALPDDDEPDDPARQCLLMACAGDAALEASPPVHEAIASPPTVAPRNAIEQRLHAIWQAAMPGVHFGVEDNIFEIGGDSLIVVQLAARVRIELSVPESEGTSLVQRLIAQPTVAAWARMFDSLLV